MTPAEVCDAVFGTYTKGGPNLTWTPSYSTYSWAAIFTGPRPDWYVDPTVHNDKRSVPIFMESLMQDA